MTISGTATLSDRVVLVTGASRGIGAAIARAVADAGADVAIGFMDHRLEAQAVADEVESLGRRAVTIQADVSDPHQAAQLISTTEAELGPLDGLVNNAGIMPSNSLTDIGDEEWNAVIGTNLSGPFYCARAVLPGMIDRGSGAIVMVSSRLGQIGWAELSHYSASKAGLLGLTKSMAREFGPKGIRVNAVAPGVTVTDMTRDLVEGEVGRRRLAELPSGRFAQPEDVAATVVFLLSDAASLYHGQTLNPNGGGYMP